ncbi:(2Fe-2S)-binding protein [Orrella sp. JC864]|uniref:(2Fe-2S)-binding protein n=1 Tax=Orrella sp. JC864 TaxID=3120298 RepID=UPI0012BBE36D
MHTESVSPAPALFASETPAASSLVTLQFEGRPLRVPAGISVAAALLLHGGAPYRSTPVSAAPRAPYCMMGVCFECLVEIDGKPNRQACLAPVREGMAVRRQQGAPALPLPREEQEHGC